MGDPLNAEEVVAKARWHSSYTGDLGAFIGFPAARAALAALADAGFVLVPPDAWDEVWVAPGELPSSGESWRRSSFPSVYRRVIVLTDCASVSLESPNAPNAKESTDE